MRAAGLGVLIGAAGCGGHHWIDYACDLSTAPHRDAIAFVPGNGGAIELRRDDGAHRLPWPACAGTGEHITGIVALADGWSALVYGYEVESGNMFESGTTGDEHACIVDFRTGATRDVSPVLLGNDIRMFHPTVGPRTGWIYDHMLGSAVRVIDLDGNREATLPDTGEYLDTEIAVAELDGTIRIVTGHLEEISQAHPIYKGSLVIRDYDPTAWPPVAGGPRTIAVGGRADAVAISADGRWVGYTGKPYYVGMESAGSVADAGVIDLETGRVVFERLHVPGDLSIHDIVSTSGGPWTLVTTDPDIPNGHVTSAHWIDPTGADTGSPRHVADDYNVELTWLPSRNKVESDVSCDVDLLDLPPPVK